MLLSNKGKSLEEIEPRTTAPSNQKLLPEWGGDGKSVAGRGGGKGGSPTENEIEGRRGFEQG